MVKKLIEIRCSNCGEIVGTLDETIEYSWGLEQRITLVNSGCSCVKEPWERLLEERQAEFDDIVSRLEHELREMRQRLRDETGGDAPTLT